MKDVIKTLEDIRFERCQPGTGGESRDREFTALTYAIKVLKRIEVGRIEKKLYEFNNEHQATVFITTGRAKTRYPIQFKRWMKPLAQVIVTDLLNKEK